MEDEAGKYHVPEGPVLHRQSAQEAAERMKAPGGHPGCNPTIESVAPLVDALGRKRVGGVEADGDPAAGAQQPRQALERLLTIWCVMQHTEAVDQIEGLRPERKVKNTGLDGMELRAGTEFLFAESTAKLRSTAITSPPRLRTTSAKRPIPHPTSRTRFPRTCSGVQPVLAPKVLSDSLCESLSNWVVRWTVHS